MGYFSIECFSPKGYIPSAVKRCPGANSSLGAPSFKSTLSTKYWDADAKLSYYGYRYNSTSLGRWMSRDPISEVGGLNLYAFICNNTTWKVDVLGRAELIKDCDWQVMIGHVTSLGLEALNDWLGKKPDAEGCGDNKIGFATCAADYLNSHVPPNYLIPIPPELLLLNPNEDITEAHLALLNKIKGKLQHLKDLPPLSNDNASYSYLGATEALNIKNAVLAEAKKQFLKDGNCCTSITVEFKCSPDIKDLIDQEIQAFGKLNDLPKPLRVFANAENPCGKKYTVKQNE